MIVNQMIVDIVVEHMIANFVQHLLMIEEFDDEKFLNMVVKQMDHVHLLMYHVFDEMMNDVDHYLMLIHLLVMFLKKQN